MHILDQATLVAASAVFLSWMEILVFRRVGFVHALPWDRSQERGQKYFTQRERYIEIHEINILKILYNVYVANLSPLDEIN